MKVKTRFAPSPTGLLHLGNARTALFSALWARRNEGVFLLRIEDTDRARSRAEYVDALQQDLAWLGCDWQEGPGVGGPHGPYLQSLRGVIYEEYFGILQRQGLSYPCFCSDQVLEQMRRRQQAAAQPPRYDGTCARLTAAEAGKRMAKGETPAWRFRVPPAGAVQFDDLVRGRQQLRAADIGDFIVRRADGSPSFLFSNALDDALMEVTHVLRGADHLSNTPRQLLLLQALGLTAPRYGHLPLILGQDASPLAKRMGSASLGELRAQGYLPQALLNYLARLGHVYPDNSLEDVQGLATGFDLERVGRAPAHFDPQQLAYWQRQAALNLSDAAFAEWIGAALADAVPADRRSAFVEAVRGNVLLPQEASVWARVLFSDEPPSIDESGRAILAQAGPDYFAAAEQALALHGLDFPAAMQRLRQDTGAKGKALFQPLRVALTGQPDGPELARLLPLMGIERALHRLRQAHTRKDGDHA